MGSVGAGSIIGGRCKVGAREGGIAQERGGGANQQGGMSQIKGRVEGVIPRKRKDLEKVEFS